MADSPLIPVRDLLVRELLPVFAAGRVSRSADVATYLAAGDVQLSAYMRGVQQEVGRFNLHNVLLYVRPDRHVRDDSTPANRTAAYFCQLYGGRWPSDRGGLHREDNRDMAVA